MGGIIMKFIVKPKCFISANSCKNYGHCGTQCMAKCGSFGIPF